MSNVSRPDEGLIFEVIKIMEFEMKVALFSPLTVKNHFFSGGKEHFR